MQLRIRENRNPEPFHDGMHEDKVHLHFDCGNCGHEFDENLLSSLDKGQEWFGALSEPDQQLIAKVFGCEYQPVGLSSVPCIRLKNGNIAYVVNLSCPNCNRLSIAVVDFYEMQPARYIASLAGIAEVEQT